MSIRAIAFALLLLTACAPEKKPDAPAPAVETVAATQTVATTTAEAEAPGTWAGQIEVAQPVSMFNYVGAESGDFAPMRFRNDSEAGKKILAACSNDDMCEFTGVVEWLDEPPPENASAIGQIVRVDSVKRLPPTP
jgi:outer membrane murein-binding lipoprotein Lpp